MDYQVQAVSANALSVKELETCVSIIREGCAANAGIASQQLPQALWIAVARVRDEIVGVGAIKMQRPRYAQGRARKSGFSFDPKMHELGYVAVLKAHRENHLSTRIVQELLAVFHGPLWATTSNERMKSSLGKRGFVKEGREWTSDKGEQLSLWVKLAT